METRKQLLTLEDFVSEYSISRTSAYREMVMGRLQFTKVGRRSYVSRGDAENWVQALRKTSEGHHGK